MHQGHAVHENSGSCFLLPRTLRVLLMAPPRVLVLLRPWDRPHGPFQLGLIFPKAFHQFWKLSRSVYRGKQWENLPAPNQHAHTVSSVKQSSRMHLTRAVCGRQPVCPEEPAFLIAPRPRVTELECVSLRGRCYGDFINNTVFRIPVPSTHRKGRQAGNAEQGGENNDLAPPPPAREEGARLPFHLIGRKLRSPERSCHLPRRRPSRLAKPGREKQIRAPTCFDQGLKGMSGGFCRGGKVPGQQQGWDCGSGDGDKSCPCPLCAGLACPEPPVCQAGLHTSHVSSHHFSPHHPSSTLLSRTT